VDSEVFGLFELCERVRRESGGSFDITRGGGGVELDQARSSVGLPAPSASVDLGGVGKGFGLDLAADLLRNAGIENALLQGGTSTAVAIGARPDGEPWVIEVPAASGEPLRVAIRDEAVSVSEATSSRGAAHVVDPASGDAAAGAQVAVCVAESAAEADAWSTAMIVRRVHAGMRSAWWSEGEWVVSEGWQR
jgi:thiamine biosynthesis lipoprotein